MVFSFWAKQRRGVDSQKQEKVGAGWTEQNAGEGAEKEDKEVKKAIVSGQ